MARQISKEEIKNAFELAIGKNKCRISMSKLIERLSKILDLIKGQLKSIPNIYFYCKKHMGDMGWVINKKLDGFKKE